MSDRPYRVRTAPQPRSSARCKTFFDNHEERIYKRSNTLVRHSETTSETETDTQATFTSHHALLPMVHLFCKQPWRKFYKCGCRIEIVMPVARLYYWLNYQQLRLDRNEGAK